MKRLWVDSETAPSVGCSFHYGDPDPTNRGAAGSVLSADRCTTPCWTTPFPNTSTETPVDAGNRHLNEVPTSAQPDNPQMLLCPALAVAMIEKPRRERVCDRACPGNGEVAVVDVEGLIAV